MKLTSFRVERFRNVLDSGVIDAAGAVTCLVGKNESGKTNILHALHTLKPASTDRSFDEQQYPRWLQKEHQRSGKFASAKPISATFELTEAEVAAVNEEFGEGVLISNFWSISVKYDGSTIFTVKVDEKAACNAIEERLGTDTGAVKLAALRTELDSCAAETSPDSNGAQVATVEAQKAQQARAEVDRLYPESIDVDLAVYHELDALLPQFFYFDEYSQLRGRTNIEPLIEAPGLLT